MSIARSPTTAIRLLLIAVGAAILAGCAPFGSAVPSAASGPGELTRQLLITMRQDASAATAVLGDPGSFYLRRRGYGPTPGVDRTLDAIADDYGLRRVDGWYIASLGEYCEVYELRPGQSMDDVLERIATDPRVGLVQAMNVFETEGAMIYDDPFAPMQPALASMAIDAAHALSTGRGVTVAIIDSSVDARHAELRGKVRAEKNLVDNHAFRGAEVHGTAVAGVIGSAANNGEGIVGVAPDSSLASLRACWTVEESTGRAQCSSFSLALALESAIELEVDVINLSLAGPPDPLLEALIDSAADAGIVVVAAYPERHGPGSGFPASHPRVIAAESAETPLGGNIRNLLRAPGAEIVSTSPNNGYAFFSGNSMAAAYVTGVAALVRERRPGITSAELIELLTATGIGRTVNACRAVAGSNGSRADDGDDVCRIVLD